MRIIRKFVRRRKVTKRKITRRVIASKPLRDAIRKELRKNVETKHAYHTSGDGLTKFNSGITATGDMMQIMPNISQGTADNARIGDQIRGQKLNVKGYVKFDTTTSSGYNNQGNPTVLCRLMVVSLKTKPNYTEATSSSTPLSGLLKKGGTTTSFSGILSDIYAPINTDLWTVHSDRRFYLNQDYLAQYGGGTQQIVGQDIKNTVKFFNISVKCKKLMKYDANISSGVLPTNFGPMLLLGYSYLNADSPDTLSTKLGLQYDSLFSYEDA